MTDLEFQKTPLAAPDTLADSLLDGGGPMVFPALRDRISTGRPGRLPLQAFATSSPEVAAKLVRVLAGEGLVVSTGQQPVLFLGPLYVLFKALTAIELARGLEEHLGVPVVPVFWVASDDHDWDEIGQTSVPAADGTVETLRMTAPEGRQRRPVGPTALGNGIGDLVDGLSHLLPPSEFTPAYIECVNRHYASSASFSQAFGGLLSELLEGLDLAWLDSANPDLKRASVPFFAEMLEDPSTVLLAEQDGDASIRDAGFQPAIAPVDGALPLFYDDGEARVRVVRAADGSGFSAGKDGEVQPAEAWLERLAAEPERFSPNVSSRPPLESWLMPLAATVLGPGEIAYWSQLGHLFEAVSVPFPAVQPRAAYRVVEPRIRKILDALEIAADDLADGGDAVSRAVTEAARPDAVDRAVGELKEALSGYSASVESAIASELPGLNAAAGKTSKALNDAVRNLDRRVDAAVREKNQAALSKVARASAILWPARRPQERVVSPFYFLGRYGRAFIEAAHERVGSEVDDFLAGSLGDS